STGHGCVLVCSTVIVPGAAPAGEDAPPSMTAEWSSSVAIAIASTITSASALVSWSPFAPAGPSASLHAASRAAAAIAPIVPRFIIPCLRFGRPRSAGRRSDARRHALAVVARRRTGEQGCVPPGGVSGFQGRFGDARRNRLDFGRLRHVPRPP